VNRYRELTDWTAPNAEYATETREELLYNKEKLLANGTASIVLPRLFANVLQETSGSQKLLLLQEQMLLIDKL
jgi:hypothetical protein